MLDAPPLTSAFVVRWLAPGHFTAQLQGWTSLPCVHTDRHGFDISSGVPWVQWGVCSSKSVVLSSETARDGGLERCGGRKAGGSIPKPTPRLFAGRDRQRWTSPPSAPGWLDMWEL